MRRYSLACKIGDCFLVAVSHRLLRWLILIEILSMNTCGIIMSKSKTLKACSIGCPQGTFESNPCTNFRDRICQECAKCRGATYEARPCSGTSDRQCIHAAHPLLITGELTTNRYFDELYHKKLEIKRRKKLKVEASENVFLEDLHTLRNLETTYYVTDKTQASDFFWDRESGLRVHIGILNIHLISEFMDVDHESDNKYVLGNPDGMEDKTRFRSVIREFCRHPIPDSYQVTLEILRDRTTTAQLMTCDSSNATKPRCPTWLKDGDTYMHRTPNDACHKMAKGTFPKLLKQAANSIVCTDQSALMRDVFNQTSSQERPITFPPRKCRSARSRCDQCIEQVRCQSPDIFEKKCCQVDCYTLLDCKVAHSEECTGAPIECAMGDAYRYTIQPVFDNVGASHQCHIRRHRPEILYEVFYFVQIPGTSFQTSKVYRTIYADEKVHRSRGANTADFLTIEHNIGIELQDEFLLHRKQVDDEQYNYTVLSMKLLEELRSNRLQIHEISPQIFIASTQFERPFDYSTSTWTRMNDCHKNTSKFRTVVPYGEVLSQGVNVNIQNGTDPFHYFLKSIDNPPFIRFNVPGSKSILPYYFRDNGPVLLTNGTLSATLDLTTGGRIWDIHISGKMSNCPGYVGIVISNREEQEELFRYDLLVRCPSEFNITFRVPNWGQHQDRTFDIRLEDAKRSYDIYLTQLTFEQVRLELEPEAIQMLQQPKISSIIFIIVIASLFTSFITFIAVYIYTEAAKERLLHRVTRGDLPAKLYSDLAATTAIRPHKKFSATTDCQSLSQKPSSRQRLRGSCLCPLYVAFRLVYSFSFTFTVFYVVLSTVISDDANELSQLETIQVEKRNRSVSLAAVIEQHGTEEIARQQDLVASMQSSCSHYVGELFDSMALQMDKILAVGKHSEGLYQLNVSISSVVEERIRTRLKGFGTAISNFRSGYQSRITADIVPSLAKYQKYLNSIFHNNWLSFPQKLFGESTFSEEQAMSDLKTGCNFTGTEVDFVNFLEIQEVEEIQLWAKQLWERFSEKFPQLPPLPTVSTESLQCTLDEDDSVPNLTRRTPLYQLHSSHFLTSPIPDDKTTGNVFPETVVVVGGEEATGTRRTGTQKQPVTAPPVVFSTKVFREVFDAGMLRIAFLLLDLLVLAYRCTLTYMTARAICRRFPKSQLQNKDSGLYPWPCQPLTDGNQTTGSETLGQRDSMTGLDATTTPTMMTTTTTHEATERNSSISNQNNIYTDPQTLVIQNISSLQRPSRPPQHQEQQQNPMGEAQGPVQIGVKMIPNSGLAVAGRSPSPPTKSDEEPPPGYTSMRAVFGRLVENDAFPKVIVLAMFVVIVYAFLRLVTVFLDLKFLVGVRAFGVFVNVLSVQVNQTNFYIVDQARFFNEVTMKAFEAQVNMELANLQSMVDFFNAEQRRLVANYVSELCSVVDTGRSRWSCDTSFSPPLLTLPMIPCKFVPIQPHLFSGSKVRDYESQVEASFQRPVEAARNILLKSIYALLVALTAMMVVHIFGWIASRCLRLRCRVPGTMSFAVGAASTGAGAGSSLRNDSSVQTFIHRHDVSDYDSEENDVEFTRHTTVTNITMYRGRTGTAEFKYSETNV